jgi:acetolactate synthase-1/2/3 large subunit
VGLVGDPGSVLGQLLAAARERSWPRSGWRAELEAVREAALARHEALERADAVPLHPLRVVAAVRAALRAGDCLALDGGEFARWARWGLAGGPFEFLVNGKLGGLGSGIPFAIAAALARPAARAVAFVGDGTFGFHAMELDTAVRHGVPCVVVVGNDAGWGTERLRQIEQYGPERVVVADLLPTRYDRLAEALGAHGELVERPEELGPAIERALRSRGPACVNVRIASADRP